VRVVTLTTCHNRRECTLAALSDLQAQDLPDHVTLLHVLVDDGSTDGTTQAVRDHYPKVEIIQGNGQLYWAGGMRYGWCRSVSKKAFDYLFVYNDDVRFDKTAIADLLQSSASLQNFRAPHIIVGSFRSTDGKATTYGGRRRSSRWHPLKFANIIEPNGELQQVDTLNMNGALLSRSTLSRIGFLSDHFVHSGADFEYGLKLRKAGGFVYVSERHIGRCDLNPAADSSPENASSLREGIHRLFDEKREPFKQRLLYYQEHGGTFWLLHWITPYITLWFRYILNRASK
jgi:GT2 family glycosyltransferase